MSRVSKSVKNVKISISFLIVTTLLNFISRGVFIKELGEDVVGLSSTLINVLGFLNLAELGLSSAIASTLYKPLYNRNSTACCDIVSIYGYLYRLIGFGILSVGIIISFFLPQFFDGSGVSMVYVYCGFYTYLFTSLIGYFINYKQTILSADQNEYKITFRYNIILVIKLLFQVAALKFIDNSFILWLAIELFFGLCYGLWINYTVNKHYTWLNTSFERGRRVCKDYKQLFRTILQVIPHNVGAFVLYQTDGILVYSFSSLAMVTIYTNYTMILNRATVIVNTTMRGIAASVGNLIASDDKIQIKRIFFEMNSGLAFLATVAVTTFLFQTDAFINLWLGPGFILPNNILYAMLYATYVGIIRLSINTFIGGYVLYNDVWAPITEAILKLVMSMILGYYYGIFGVVMGTVISLTFIVVIWKPIFLYRRGFKESSLEYWMALFKYLVLLVLTILMTYLLIENVSIPSNENWIGFIIRSLIIALYSGTIFLFSSYWTHNGTKDLLGRVWCGIRQKYRLRFS